MIQEDDEAYSARIDAEENYSDEDKDLNRWNTEEYRRKNNLD